MVAVSAAAPTALPERVPLVGELVQVRSRRWIVEEVVDPTGPKASAQVRLACVDDDNQGQSLEVLWEHEPDRWILADEGWADLASKGLDSPRLFAAFLNTLRWNCTTATDPRLFQAPFRAGITIDAYQMEPLRKALTLPRVNLLIADDTGLGKTIEAGLIARELLLRRKAKEIVVAAPPSMLEQWRTEMEERFGLVFEILDRGYVSRIRRERGFGVNPWRTHSRFLVSHNLLIDPAYTDPMREWLGKSRPGSLLILDEAHHAAPSSGGRYGIETKITKAVRDLAHRFEHRLFLSATPHNGHSNSFSTLLELLDPYRFTRGVKVRAQTDLEPVMVRRIKEDLRSIQGGFPERNVVRLDIDGLPDDAPELVLSKLLDEYRSAREQRYASESAKVRFAAGLMVVGLQQRLLSSIEAFARSLKVHRQTVQRHWDKAHEPKSAASLHPEAADQEALGFLKPADADDERGGLSPEEADADEAAQIEQIDAASRPAADPETAAWVREQELLDQMEEIADGARHIPDAKALHLIDWIREHQCERLPAFGGTATGLPPTWNDRRVLIFTENREGTKRYLKSILDQAVEGTERADERIGVIDGLTSKARRREVQRRFNADPAEEPLRILIATDAAREGLNLQAHCSDLFHFDLPWNPGRIEQRNGRIDRKLQPATEVNCHYFVLPQRIEDRVLEVLVTKTETIKRELGSLSQVIDDSVERRMLSEGIRHRDADALRSEIEAESLNDAKRQATAEELELARERSQALEAQIEACRSLLDRSRKWAGFSSQPFRDAIDCSLELLGAPPLAEGTDDERRKVWTFPPLEQRAAADPSWMSTIDSLRVPRKIDQNLPEWRREAPIRPVVFEDAGRLDEETVHLHLEQRVAQRLLSRFRAQGFVYHDLSRACLAQSRDSIPRVILLGRLSLYGRGAERLHEEIVPVAARWSDPASRSEPLKAYARDAEMHTMDLLEESLHAAGRVPNEVVQRRLMEAAAQDIEELRPQLEPRAVEHAETAKRQLAERGEREERALRETLERHRDQVEAELAHHQRDYTQLLLDFQGSDARQLREDTRQLDANIAHWRRRLDGFEQDLAREPARVREFYEVMVQRVEPIGLVYLWPETN
ncbi:DISARM system SNF2-like helicase DrmD [Candidatus Poriferisodalis sp.]|uniref:DISARM system SNF2-like helicase DrmD n=1 Tax=Candidatus Poriferisodalis sp. TaxID=3101277 RepID=UPI003B02476F